MDQNLSISEGQVEFPWRIGVTTSTGSTKPLANVCIRLRLFSEYELLLEAVMKKNQMRDFMKQDSSLVSVNCINHFDFLDCSFCVNNRNDMILMFAIIRYDKRLQKIILYQLYKNHCRNDPFLQVTL